MSAWRQTQGLPAVVEDVLETWYGRRFTVETLIALVLEVRPAAHPIAIRRAVERVIASPCIPLRVEHARHPYPHRVLWCPERVYLAS